MKKLSQDDLERLKCLTLRANSMLKEAQACLEQIEAILKKKGST
jgi:hypothetical protein